MKAYKYNKENLEFKKEITCQPNPKKKGEYLIPGNSTTKKPPEVKEFQTVIYNIDNDNWEIVPDYRDYKYYDENGEAHRIYELNKEPPENHSTEPKPDTYYKLVEGYWVEDEALKKEYQIEKIAEVRWDHEEKGIIVDDVEIDTSDRSKSLIVGKALRAQKDDSITFKFKSKSGWVVMNSEDILKITDCLDDYVQKCFDREEELIKKLENDELKDNDINSGWPDREY